MKPWGNLGVVETIYEEEYDYISSSTSPLSRSVLSSPPTPLHSRVKAWSSETGRKPDVLIHVQGSAFHLHKDPLSSRSTYLRRQLREHSELTLSPPLNITAETFALVADFSYGTHLLVTPFNVAPLLIAAELLGMTATKGEGDQNLKQITEGYFRRFVAVNVEYAAIVFRSCLALLPEAETTACLVSRCVEVMNLSEDGEGLDGYFNDVTSLRAEDFKIVAGSMHERFEYHDLLYRIVHFYLEEHNGEITEEEKTQICNSIDCNKLSPQLLLHAVQNPRMPLRFIVRAMLVEQLNTRHSIYSAVTVNHQSSRGSRLHHRPARNQMTLGAILQRDATMGETAQLKVAMDATSSRIQTLEKQLLCMKKILQASDQINTSEGREDGDSSRDVLKSSGRSASFHYGSRNTTERDDRKAPSSSSCRFTGLEERSGFRSSSSENLCNNIIDSPRIKKNIGQWLLEGLKSALRVSNSSTKNGSDHKKFSSQSENGKIRRGENGIDHSHQR